MTDDAYTKLLCPHNQELFVGQIHNITHYAHADGASCTTLNSFVQTADVTLAEMGTLEGIGDLTKEETPLMRAAFLSSLTLRLSYYKKLAVLSRTIEKEREKRIYDMQAIHISIDTFQALILRLVRFARTAHNRETLAWELEKVFGKIVWENIHAIGSDDLFQHSQAPQQGSYKLPHYKMISVKNENLSNEFLEWEEDVEISKRRKKKVRGSGLVFP